MAEAADQPQHQCHGYKSTDKVSGSLSGTTAMGQKQQSDRANNTEKSADNTVNISMTENISQTVGCKTHSGSQRADRGGG